MKPVRNKKFHSNFCSQSRCKAAFLIGVIVSSHLICLKQLLCCERKQTSLLRMYRNCYQMCPDADDETARSMQACANDLKNEMDYNCKLLNLKCNLLPLLITSPQMLLMTLLVTFQITSSYFAGILLKKQVTRIRCFRSECRLSIH